MSTGPLPEVQTLHRAELDTFETELTAAGFAIRSGDEHYWTGPISPELRDLTTAEHMMINIRDGWPYLHPYLFVLGLGARAHVSASGNVCLWEEDDPGYEDWLSLERIDERIAAWAADQRAGPADLPFDGHYYFDHFETTTLLELDLDKLMSDGLIRAEDGASGELRATFTTNVYRLGTRGSTPVTWFWRDRQTPPATVSKLRERLTEDQARLFDRLRSGRRNNRAVIALLLWPEADTVNGIAVRFAGPRLQTEHAAIEIARTDESVRRLRGGPHQAELAPKTAMIFGVGAIGSEVARLLAQSGIGRLRLVDYELLRPGNLTRHAASGDYVGLPKAEALAKTIQASLPHVEIEPVKGRLWNQVAVERLLSGMDVVVETTGNRAYRNFLSRIVAGRIPIVAAGLHRRGAIGRIVVEAGPAHPIWSRSGDAAFPEIPADPNRAGDRQWEVGCGSPVNNASPIAVAAVAAAAAAEIVDALIGDPSDHDVVDVFEPIDEAPFDSPGRIVFRPT